MQYEVVKPFIGKNGKQYSMGDTVSQSDFDQLDNTAKENLKKVDEKNQQQQTEQKKQQFH